MSKPGEIFKTQDGSHSILNAEFNVSYHSKYGAIQESRHVFIEAGLYPVLEKKDDIRIFEMGFGTGLNAFLSLLVAKKRNKKIYYESVESHPITFEQAQFLNYPESLSALNISNDAKDFLALHDCSWDQINQITPSFSLLKWHKKIQDTPLTGGYDVVFYDAFAPESQPELWEEEVIGKVVESMNPDGIFVTYCAKGVVKRLLKSQGMVVKGIPGPPGKREMTRAVKSDI